MNEVTKECIKKNIKCYEDRLKEINHSIDSITERLTNMTKEKEELLLKIKQLKEDLEDETTNQ